MPDKVSFFDSSDFMPHGHCFLWYPEILWLQVLSDAAIAIAYLLIPLALIYFVYKRREVRGRRKDGSEFPMDLSISAFRMDDGQQFCGVVRDITKSKQAEENRQALIKKLMESNTELERFAYVASHDMQEPIRMVMNFSEIIAKDYDARLDDEGREYLKIVQDSVTRLRNMVHDLLQYSRMGYDTDNLSTVDMKEKVEHARMNLSELIRETGAELKVETMPVLRGTPVQLLRLLQNLITNAIKYQSPEVRPSWNWRPKIRVPCGSFRSATMA